MSSTRTVESETGDGTRPGRTPNPGPGALAAEVVLPESASYRFKRRVLGKPLVNDELHGEKQQHHRARDHGDRKSTRLNSSHHIISYAVFCLKKEKHTSELQSPDHIRCRHLLEKKHRSHTLYI